MKFQTKIIFATLGILSLTLILNSVLSLASFEKIYVQSLLSTYEIAGKNLKRKIEQSLRFGKPLDKFQGMDKLITGLMEKNTDIKSVAVADKSGRILYHSDPKERGTELPFHDLLSDAGTDKLPDSISRMSEGRYHTILPLYDRSRQLSGILSLSFSRDVIYKKLRIMAAENMKILWLMLLLTSVGLIFLLALMVVHPIKKEIWDIGSQLVWPENADETNRLYYSLSVPGTASSGEGDSTSPAIPPPQNFQAPSNYLNLQHIRGEIDRIGYFLMGFVQENLQMMHSLEKLDQCQNDLLSQFDRLGTIARRMDHILLECQDILTTEKLIVIRRFSKDMMALSEQFLIIRHIIDCQKQARRISV